MLQISQTEFDRLVKEFKMNWEWADARGMTGQRVEFALLGVLNELGIRGEEDQ